MAAFYETTSSLKRCGMAHVVRDLTVLPATMPLPSQPKLVLILPTPEGWKAELT